MLSNLQVFILGIPIIYIASDVPSSNFFVRAGIVFLNDLTVLAFIFVPKMYMVATNFKPDMKYIRTMTSPATDQISDVTEN